jgi:molybdenum cofactor cytidylyltransferase
MSGTAGDRGVGAVVLAAGAGTRFGGDKLLAELEGRPILQHVLDAVARIEVRPRVVVLPGPSRLDARIDWRDEVRVVNPTPEAGLARSLRVGVASCLDARPDVTGILVLLGDQPRTSPQVMGALIDALPAAAAAGAWAVVPRYAEGGGANPALLLRAALARVPDLEGDRGMGALLASEPGRTYPVEVPGANPDIDTPADLSALADGGR